MFQQVEKPEVGSWGRRRRVITPGYGSGTERGHCCLPHRSARL